jgi:hypothetical protein
MSLTSFEVGFPIEFKEREKSVPPSLIEMD